MIPTRLYPDARPTRLLGFRSTGPSGFFRRASFAAPEAELCGALRALGAPADLTARLRRFLAARHPGEQERIYHGLAHTHEVAALTARVVRARADMPDERKALLVLAAALHDVDPSRPPNTPARVAGTLAHLDADPEARAPLPPQDRARFSVVAARFHSRKGGLMKKTAGVLSLLAASVLAAVSVHAAGFRDVGVGVILGEPIGGTAKLWLDDRVAVDLGAGFSDGNAGVWGDVLWHDWSLLPQPKDGRLGAYLGAGPQVRSGDDARFGIRTIAGATYRPSGHPLEVFLEGGPLFRLTQGGAVDGVVGLGLRVYGWGGKR